jgi:hypothetical protein
MASAARRCSKTNPRRYSRRGIEHVDDERRTMLRPVAHQRPCLMVEADDAKMLKAIYWAINGASMQTFFSPYYLRIRQAYRASINGFVFNATILLTAFLLVN